MMRWRHFAALAVVASPAVAQDDLADATRGPETELREMATDRPNLTDSPTTIDAGHVQIEAGAIDYTFNRTRTERSRTYSYGDFNVRVGVLANLELNVIVRPHIGSHARDPRFGVRESAIGFGDSTVGGKLNFWGNDGGDATWATAFAIKPQVKLPTARPDLGNGNVEASVSLPFTMNLPAGFGLSVQPSLSRVRDEADRGYVTSYEAALALDHDIGPLNAYVEYVFDDTNEDCAPDQQLLDLGATAAVTRNLVVDAGIGIGLSDAAEDFRFLLGGSVRF